jgi:hypothetical protein
MTSQSNRLGVADWLISTAKRNPEGLLLLAAGAALLARTSRPSTAWGDTRRTDDAYRGYQGASESSQDSSPSWRGRAQMSDAMDAAQQTAADMGSRVSEAGSRMSDTASSYAASASRFANEATRSIAQRSGEFYDQGTATLQSTVQRIVREQPLMVALAGLAAGAAVAAAFPRTQIEERTLGPAGERFTDFAAQKAEQLKNAGMAAGEHLMSSAEQRGLSPEGLKEMARGAADTFGRAMSEQGAGSRAGAGPGSGGSSGSGSAPRPQPTDSDAMERLE